MQAAVDTRAEQPRYSADVLRAVVEQHAEDAAFLWTMRRAAVEAPHTRLPDLVRLDERIAANLDGLRIAGGGGWKLASKALLHGEGGEVFTAAVLACESGRADRIERVLAVSPTDELARGVAGALTWLPFRKVEIALARLRAAPSPLARRIALVAHSAHRRDPKRALDAALLADDSSLRATALRAIGELRRTDRRSALSAGLFADEKDCRFWAAWSATLLGDAAGTPVLREIAARGGVRAEASATLAAIALEHDEARVWIEELGRRPELRRIATRAAAALGDPRALSMLLDWLSVPELARVAGDAITTITGIAIEGDLAGEPPPGFASGPSDDADDEDTTPDPDEHLAWPRAALVRAAVERARAGFAPGVRHLLGRTVEKGSLSRALAEGRQPERARAAFELARMGEPLFDVSAPAGRQVRALAALEAR